MSLVHPEFSLAMPWFDMIGPGSFRWSRELFERPGGTAARAARVLRPGHDRPGLRGAQGSERVVFHVVQGQDGLDHGGAPLRAAPQLGGQDFPVLQAGVAPLADAAALRPTAVPRPGSTPSARSARAACASRNRKPAGLLFSARTSPRARAPRPR